MPIAKPKAGQIWRRGDRHVEVISVDKPAKGWTPLVIIKTVEQTRKGFAISKKSGVHSSGMPVERFLKQFTLVAR